MKPSILEATRIQARAAIPIVRALEAEIGKERAHAIVGKAIAGSYVEWRDKLGFEADTHPGDAERDGREDLVALLCPTVENPTVETPTGGNE